MVDEHELEELELSLSRGVWRAQNWGLPPKPSAVGAKVSAVFSPNVQEVDKSWTKLTNALAGQFCASLNFMDSTQSINPKWAFGPSGALLQSNITSSHIKLGMLPGENVCTENLTPWKKLLPCGAKRGLATFLNADHIHSTKYHSLGLTLRKICADSDEAGKCMSSPHIELTLYVALVFDPLSLPDNVRSALYEREAATSNWSIRTLFGIGVTSACPLATSSRILIDTSSGEFELLPSKSHVEQIQDIYVFDIKRLVEQGVNNLSAKYLKTKIYGIFPKPRIHATRFLIGHGNERGGIVTKIFNEGTKPLRVILLDMIPWYLRVFLHSMKVLNTQPLAVHFEPGVDRSKPYSLEMVLDIPARSHVEISIDFEKSILKWLEYPPDANKGFYINSAVILALLPDKTNFTVGIDRHSSNFLESLSKDSDVSVPILVELYTEALLVNLPTPDFSMPYNVICLTCTVIALAFGPLANITTKGLTLVKPEDIPKSLKDKVKDKILGLIKKVKRTDSSEEGENTANDETDTSTDDTKKER